VLVLTFAVLIPLLLAGPTAAQAPSDPPPTVAADASLESLFTDFLHYARLGRFTMADAFAKALLEHPDLDPVKLLDLSLADKKSVATLQIIVENSTIGERAARVLELIQEGEFQRRQNPELIRANVQKLGGDPQQEYYALRHLADSGEYAIPFMLDVLLDPARADLKPRVVRALPKIGKAAVNPLVMALALDDHEEDARLHVIHALGEIGYPHAIPYLRELAEDTDRPEQTRKAARDAIVRINAIRGRSFEGTPAGLFHELAEQYYNEVDSVRSDPRLTKANVWYWDATDAPGRVRATAVPERLFGPIMAMRAGEEALLLEPDRRDSIALWLASNIRRESRLGLDVESGHPDEMPDEVDPTRPEAFPRALYFTQAAGPRYAHMVLDRAVRDGDAAVALGAIEALRITAGESSLVGMEDHKQPLVRALQFPNLVVRTRAALALGAALPKSPFAGAEHVVPILANALTQTGRQQMLVVDADPGNLNRVMEALRSKNHEVIGETGFYRGMNRARVEFQTVSAIVISSDIADPDLPTAIRELRGEFRFSQTPVLILDKPEQGLMGEELASLDRAADHLDAAADGDAIDARRTAVAGRTGQGRLDPALALSMALQSAETLRGIAEDGRTVFDFGQAEAHLIAALSSPDEPLQIASASVLALARTESAQRSIAHVAFDSANTRTLRVSAFGSLAESAKNNGNLLEDGHIADLVSIARDDADLVIRTAASEAIGAVNLKSNRASEIIREYHAG
jgi:HEAT repeat protein